VSDSHCGMRRSPSRVSQMQLPDGWSLASEMVVKKACSAADERGSRSLSTRRARSPLRTCGFGRVATALAATSASFLLSSPPTSLFRPGALLHVARPLPTAAAARSGPRHLGPLVFDVHYMGRQPARGARLPIRLMGIIAKLSSHAAPASTPRSVLAW